MCAFSSVFLSVILSSLGFPVSALFCKYRVGVSTWQARKEREGGGERRERERNRQGERERERERETKRERMMHFLSAEESSFPSILSGTEGEERDEWKGLASSCFGGGFLFYFRYTNDLDSLCVALVSCTKVSGLFFKTTSDTTPLSLTLSLSSTPTQSS
jgi:hypothetical protein